MGEHGYIIGLILGLCIGIGGGIGVGIATGRLQKPWSELSKKEKKRKIATITAGVVLFVAGLVVFLIMLHTYLVNSR